MTATADRRAGILEQLFRLLGSLEITLSSGQIAAGNFVHNRNELPAEKVPGIILLDADEVNDMRLSEAARPGALQTHILPQLVKLTPEIYVVLDVRKPQNPAVGDDLNIARMAILGAIWADQTLQTLVGTNGRIVYDGCITDLARNRTMQGQLGISVTFTYPLLPREVVGV